MSEIPTPNRWWMPPLGERILSLVPFQDMLVIATDGGIWTIVPPGSMGLDGHTVQQIKRHVGQPGTVIVGGA